MSGSVAKPLTEEQEKRKFEGVAGEGMEKSWVYQLEDTILMLDMVEKLPAIGS